MPYPPLNISHKIVHLSQRMAPGVSSIMAPPEGTQESGRGSRRARDVPLMEEQEEEGHSEDASEEVGGASTQIPSVAPHNLTGVTDLTPNLTTEAEPQSYWLDPTDPSPSDEEFVNAVVSEYEDSNEPGSAMGLAPDAPVLPTRMPPLLLELRWLPPRPPTSYDGFNIYIYRDGKEEVEPGLSQ